MKPADRQKMCPNCDGRIPYDATQCPFCFAQQQLESNPVKALPPSSDPLSALYPPPYSGRPTSFETPEPKTPYHKTAAAEPQSTEDAKPLPFWSILMLTVGSHLFTLGILQFFFSDHGLLRLEINASYWFLMVLVGAPLIYLGFKNLKK